MLTQVALVVLATLALCHSSPAVTGPYQPLPPQLQYVALLPDPSSPLPRKQVLQSDPSSLFKLNKFTQAGLPLPPRGQYLFYFPGGPANAPLVYATKYDGKDEQGEEGGGEEGGTFPFGGLYNFFANWWESTTAKPAEEAKPEEKPQKLPDAQGSTSSPTSANLETFDEDEQTEPTSPKPVDPKQPEQKLFLIGQPQFFGNYDALKNPQIVKELGNKTPFPNVPMTNNQQPFVWQTKYTPITYGDPGMAATEFQKLLTASEQRETREGEKETNVLVVDNSFPLKKLSSEGDSVVVEALKVLPHAASGDEGDENSAEMTDDSAESEPAVAQVRPQAIALAGPSGVAAAAPVGTAVVGRGGLAVAAPSATAVAGPSGGQPPVVAPSRQTAQQAYIAANNQAKFLDQAAR